jgi:pathogenesis-related protein 1
MRHALWMMVLTAASLGAQGALARDMVSAHNAVRARLELPPLAWSVRLEAIAQAWANTLLARKQFFHRPHGSYGENLFEISGAGASPAGVVREWASESRNYNYSSNRCHGVCGHYTQIVWRDTKQVGCAVARDRRQEIWVCNYDPPGNWAGQRPY